MAYQVKPLNPALSQTFVDYLGALDFHHAPHWSTCFCRFYYTDYSLEDWQNRTGEQNAREALEQIQSGQMNGFLAFDQDTCIGWCCADEAGRFIRLREQMQPLIEGKKVGAVMCYVIRPEYREQGVARLLLRAAVDDFKTRGFDAILASPVDIPDSPHMRYHGTLHMYEELGFQVIEQQGAMRIMRLDLTA